MRRCIINIVIVDFFFFFQAEDGIRDLTVTGVQTCALPISDGSIPIEPARIAASSDKISPKVFSVTIDRKSTRLNSSHSQISYAVFCLKKKKNNKISPESKDSIHRCAHSTVTYIVRTVSVGR